jgi:hypothetical protein
MLKQLSTKIIRSILMIVVTKIVYTLFIGILLATFIGVGIAAFYPSPKSPEFKFAPAPYYPPQDAYMKLSQDYNRNVSIISLVAAILILIISLTVFKSLPVIADGLLLGGVLTLIYSIVRGFNSQDEKFRFIVVTIGLIIAILLGYNKFIRGGSKK